MSDTRRTPETRHGDDTVTVVQVPKQHADKVIDYVRSLEPDVTGYAAPSVLNMGGLGLAAKISGTNCTLTGGTIKPNDFNCSDDDH